MFRYVVVSFASLNILLSLPIRLWVKTVLGSHFGLGAPPILVHFSGDWEVHWGYGILTHGHILIVQSVLLRGV